MTTGNEGAASGVYRPMYARTETMPDLAGTAAGAGPGAPRPELVPVPGPADPGPRGGQGAGTGTSTPITHELGPPGPEFTDFYRTTWPNVARALSLALGDHDLAVEAADEGMARAYPRWDKIRRYDNPGGWVYRVGLNWARSYHRRLARRLPFTHPQATEPAPVEDPVIRRALMELPLRLRSVVVCRLLLDWSVADTAAALGVRPGTVQSRLHRALQSLHASLEDLR